MNGYRGRIAPSPTGYLHAGHARTFLVAAKRASEGVLVYRNEDLDRSRCREQYHCAALNDLRELGLAWQEGPDVGGPFGPYSQSARLAHYEETWRRLYEMGLLYECTHSRQELRQLTHLYSPDGEAIYPSELRGTVPSAMVSPEGPGQRNWRFRVPDGRTVFFEDQRLGGCSFEAGKDFGDFLIWRKSGVPSYELAVVVDDVLMQITEVVRGADLLVSTARQLLLYGALGWRPPTWYHSRLLTNSSGTKLSKRDRSSGFGGLLSRPDGKAALLKLCFPNGQIE